MMMTEPEKKILRLLAKEWQHSGPPGILDIGDIAGLLDLAPSEALKAIKSLYRDGLVDMNQLKTSAFLTPGGYDRAVKAL